MSPDATDGRSPDQVSARAAALTPDRAREMVERFPWVSQIPRFSWKGHILVDAFTSPFGRHQIPNVDVFFWDKVEEGVGAEHAQTVNGAILDAAIIIDGIEEDPEVYYGGGWADAFTTIYKLRAAVFGGYDYEKLMADERFSEEEYAVLVRLFGPNYNPEEPVIPMESSEACHCCPHDKLI